MISRRRLVSWTLVSALVAMIAGGCSSSRSSTPAHPAGKAAAGSTTTITTATATPLATVGGVPVTSAQVDAYLRAVEFSVNHSKVSYTTGDALAHPVATGMKPGNYTADARRAALTDEIRSILYAQELTTLKVSVTDADRTAARKSICANLGTGTLAVGASCPPLDAYTDEFRTFLTDLIARSQILARKAAGQAFPAVLASSPTSLRQVCVQLIHVADQTVLEQVVHAMAGGQTMAQASASAVTQGRANRPQEGCLFASDLPAAVSGAAPGATIPVTNTESIYVAHVLGTQTATAADFESSPPTSDPAVTKAIGDAEAAMVAGIKVTLSPASASTWDPASLDVQPT